MSLPPRRASRFRWSNFRPIVPSRGNGCKGWCWWWIVPRQGVPSGSPRAPTIYPRSAIAWRRGELCRHYARHRIAPGSRTTRCLELNATLDAIADGLVIYDIHGAVVRAKPCRPAVTVYPGGAWKLAHRAHTVLRVEKPDGIPLRPKRHPLRERYKVKLWPECWWCCIARPAISGSGSVGAPIRAEEGTIIGAVLVLTDILSCINSRNSRKPYCRWSLTTCVPPWQ